MRLLRYLPIVLIVGAIAPVIPHPQSVLCPLTAWADTVRSFGQDGRIGRAGRSGRNGENGSDRTITATGTPINLDLSGSSGSDGEDGEHGDRPYCQSQPRNVRHNLQAANGGNGGEGGNGGNGGNGGALTVYYTQTADLRQILVQSDGGTGGRGGRGGLGARGCDCRWQSWQVQVCPEGGGECQTREYQCRDGRDGNSGRDGRDGQSGQRGQLTLIPQAEPLPPENPTQAVTLNNFTGRSFSLSRHLWQTRQGATALLAPGSIIADTYREYTGRLEKQVELVWTSSDPLTTFANRTATLTLTPEQTVEVAFDQSLWVDTQVTEQGDQTRVAIANVVRADDATRLEIAEVGGSSRNLTFAVVDLARKSDILDTQFYIEYRVGEEGRRRPSRYRTRYEGEIPASFVNRSFNRFELDLGELPIDSRYLRSGTPVEIEITARRSLGNNTAEQKLQWQGTLR